MDGPEGIVERRMLFCPRLGRLDTSELITTCPICRRFSVLCCQHSESKTQCHHYRLVFTDGSCLGNGQMGATAGIGIASGEIGVGEDQWSIPVTSAIDISPKRSSQRAELLAALEVVDKLYDGTLGHGDHGDDDEHIAESDAADKTINWVVATDSEYVVLGISEWVPTWRKNGWRTVRGSRPSNLDLFKRLDAAVEELKQLCNIDIGFWHVPREYNQLADSLARHAAREAQEGEAF